MQTFISIILPMFDKKYSPFHPSEVRPQPDHFINGNMDPYINVVYITYLHVAAKIFYYPFFNLDRILTSFFVFI